MFIPPFTLLVVNSTNLNNVYYVIFCGVEYITIYSKKYSALFSRIEADT